MTRRGHGILLLGLLIGVISCDSRGGGSVESVAAIEGENLVERSGLSVRFVDVTEALDLHFVHGAAFPSDYELPAVMGSGGAFFDYDGDDDLDLYLVDTEKLPNRMLRQESDGRFHDVTDSSGLGDTGYGMGCAIGDMDNDGDLDVLVTNWGRNVLYRNDGADEEGRSVFSDVSSRFGIEGSQFSTSAVFLDYDRDGFLDLYVSQYVDYDSERVCTQEGGRRDFCGPTQFPGLSDILYRNLGGVGFRDVSREAGITGSAYAGLGVAAADLNDDGWIDVYVANDADPNNLWVNQGDGTFVDEAIVSGVAFSGYGVAEAGMGIAIGDSDGDGDLDLFVTHLVQESNTHYENGGPLGYEDTTAERGLAAAGVSTTGFGTAFVDYDNDGDLDLFVVNGAVKRRPTHDRSPPSGFWVAYGERNLLFQSEVAQRGSGRFVDVSSEAGPLTEVSRVSRGLLPADFDGDGDVDLLVTNVGGAARLYRNDGGNAGSWVEIRVSDPSLKRGALGSKVSVLTVDRRTVRHAIPSGGYLTGGGGRVHVGLGKAETVLGYEVRWPDGSEERFQGGAARRVVVLEKGQGE